MTDEQLEELRRLIDRAKDFAEQAKGQDAPLFEAELLKMSDAMDELMRRVIAAEKLVEAMKVYTTIILKENHTATEQGMARNAVDNAWIVYREASK